MGIRLLFFDQIVSTESVTKNKATSETFADFSDAGFLENNDVQVTKFMESLMENPQERNAGRLEQFS